MCLASFGGNFEMRFCCPHFPSDFANDQSFPSFHSPLLHKRLAKAFREMEAAHWTRRMFYHMSEFPSPARRKQGGFALARDRSHEYFFSEQEESIHTVNNDRHFLAIYMQRVGDGDEVFSIHHCLKTLNTRSDCQMQHLVSDRTVPDRWSSVHLRPEEEPGILIFDHSPALKLRAEYEVTVGRRV